MPENEVTAAEQMALENDLIHKRSRHIPIADKIDFAAFREMGNMLQVNPLQHLFLLAVDPTVKDNARAVVLKALFDIQQELAAGGDVAAQGYRIVMTRKRYTGRIFDGESGEETEAEEEEENEG
jgi:hypothetical protein